MMVSRMFGGDCDESRLKAYLDDELARPENDHLVDHLDHCPDCRGKLERLAGGSELWSDLRRLARPAGKSIDGDVPLDFLDTPTTRGSLGRLGPYEVTDVLGRGGF